MVRPIADLEGHPDIVELRARYDRAAETPTAHITDGLLLLAGVYLAISPWVVGFAATGQDLAASNVICGIAVGTLAFGFATAYGRTHGLAWVPVVLGAWTLVAPWVIRGGYADTGEIAGNIVIGLVTIVLGAVMMALPATRRNE